MFTSTRQYKLELGRSRTEDYSLSWLFVILNSYTRQINDNFEMIQINWLHQSEGSHNGLGSSTLWEFVACFLLNWRWTYGIFDPWKMLNQLTIPMNSLQHLDKHEIFDDEILRILCAEWTNLECVYCLLKSMGKYMHKFRNSSLIFSLLLLLVGIRHLHHRLFISSIGFHLKCVVVFGHNAPETFLFLFASLQRWIITIQFRFNSTQFNFNEFYPLPYCCAKFGWLCDLIFGSFSFYCFLNN